MYCSEFLIILSHIHHKKVLLKEIKIERITSLITALEDTYDVILFDLPPLIDLISSECLKLIDKVILITEPHSFRMARPDSLFFNEMIPSNKISELLINKFDINNSDHIKVANEIANSLKCLNPRISIKFHQLKTN